MGATRSDDHNPAPLDPNFEGFGPDTDAQGRYDQDINRQRIGSPQPDAAPAIHFDVTGKSNRLVTQMYSRQPLNDKDPFLQGAARQERLIVRLGHPPGTRTGLTRGGVGHRP